MRITKKKIIVASAAASVLALTGTAAFAFFTTTGTGAGAATVGSALPWQIVVSPTTGAALFPGVGSQTFNYSVNNVSAGPQTLNLVTAAIDSNGNGDVGANGCKSAWFTISIAGQPAGSVAAGGSNTGTGTITMIESGTDQDACQGVSPTFTLTAS